MVGEITYSYTPEDWSQERFLELGGFTVVFLNYNKAAFIEKSVASALNQDFERLEMFFMDDASTDGSGDTMEQIVRQYRGRHKVTVVRNTENQHITGQWNIVSKLATGNWYGMFCADDEAMPNRVSVAARNIKDCPTLRGLCTNYQETYNVIDIAEVKADLPVIKVFESGKNSFDDVASHKTPIIGATAWWHKSLFDRPLEKAPLDDVHLRWILQFRNEGCEEPIWLFDGSSKTVMYSVGSGITSSDNATKEELLTPVTSWLASTRAIKKFESLRVRTYEGVLRYATAWYSDSIGISILKVIGIKSRIVQSNTLGRVLLFYPSLQFGLLRVWMKYFVQELLGLRVAAIVFSLGLHR